MKKIFILAVIFFLTGRFVQAQDLISVADLAKDLKNSELIIVSAELETEFEKVHITNAVNVSYKSLFKPGTVEGLMLPDDQIAKLFGDQGITEGKKIVVYDEGSMKYSGRVYWILKYLGAQDVKVLNGGLDAWKAGRKPVTKNPSIIKKATFTAKPNSSMLASVDEVKASQGKPNTIILDVREANEFKGLDGKSKGHIPGSVNIEHLSLLTAGIMKSKTDLEKVFAAQGVTKDKTIYLICSSGVRTGKVYLALVKELGYANVKVMNGGFNEWVALGNKIDK
jgi:thiosulfate/3-mercaptopyruvate sulfurtransferase